MKIKAILPILLSIILGVVLGTMVFNQYKPKVEDVFSETENLYFLQQGVYSTEESMTTNTKNLSYYIYLLEDNKYYVYAGISKTKENAEKMAGVFKEMDNNIYIKEYPCNNKKFLESLGQYDDLLTKTSDSKSVETIAKQVISLYEELVNGEHKD